MGECSMFVMFLLSIEITADLECDNSKMTELRNLIRPAVLSALMSTGSSDLTVHDRRGKDVTKPTILFPGSNIIVDGAKCHKKLWNLGPF